MSEEGKQYLRGFNYADLHFATFLGKDNVSHNSYRQISDGYQWMDLLNLWKGRNWDSWDYWFRTLVCIFSITEADGQLYTVRVVNIFFFSPLINKCCWGIFIPDTWIFHPRSWIQNLDFISGSRIRIQIVPLGNIHDPIFSHPGFRIQVSKKVLDLGSRIRIRKTGFNHLTL